MHIERVGRGVRSAIERIRAGNAACACLVAIGVAVGLSACASVGPSGAERGPYTGIFTGEFVDGLPLYRLPSIAVVGSRRGLATE